MACRAGDAATAGTAEEKEALMPSDAEIAAARLAMLESKAWAAVFKPEAVTLLARVALEAAERVREREKARAVDHGDR